MRQSPNLKRPPMIALALMTLMLLPAWALYGKEPELSTTWGSFPRPTHAIAAPTAAPRPIGPAAEAGPFLPVILMSIHVTPLVFTGSPTADCQGTTGVSFNYGIKYLCVDTTVDGAQGQAYRFSWSIDGQIKTNLGSSGTISAQLVDVPDGICYGPSGACGDAIPRGTYQVSFFLNNVPYQTASAVIK